MCACVRVVGWVSCVRAFGRVSGRVVWVGELAVGGGAGWGRRVKGRGGGEGITIRHSTYAQTHARAQTRVHTNTHTLTHARTRAHLVLVEQGEIDKGIGNRQGILHGDVEVIVRDPHPTLAVRGCDFASGDVYPACGR